MSDDVGKSVRYQIAKTPEVAALIGERLYADVREQGSNLPAIVVAVTGSSPEEDLNSANRIMAATIDVIAFGTDRTNANAVAKAVRDYALPATLRGSVYGMDFVDVTMLSGPAEMVAEPQDGSNQWTRITKQTFVVWANPT